MYRACDFTYLKSEKHKLISQKIGYWVGAWRLDTGKQRVALVEAQENSFWCYRCSLSRAWWLFQGCMKERESENEVAQLCLTICDPMDCSLPGFSVHGIFQARVLEWVAIFFSRGSSQPRDRTRVSRIVGRRFTHWAIREALEIRRDIY